ncbi:MAG: WD40/YVTN/BNR-like repeat-containing protein [Jatrophihabitans sp.]
MNRLRSRSGVTTGILAMVGIALLTTLTGCAGQHRRPVAEKTAKASAENAGNSALRVSRAVFDGHGHALVLAAADTVRLSTNAGQSWAELRLPAAPASGQSIAVTAHQVAALTVDSAGMAYQVSADGGRSWRRTAVPLSLPTDQANLALSTDGSRVAVLASVQGSANDGSTPRLFVSSAGGPLVRRQAPASGSIAWAGDQLLLAGGPLSSRLYTSADNGLSWTARPVGGVLAPRFGLDPNTPSIGTPLVASSIEVPVTSHAGTGSSVRFYSSSNAISFVAGVRVALTSVLGSGVSAVVSAAGPNRYLVAEPGSATLHVVSGASQRTVLPSGLPGPVDSLSFADAQHGLAQVTLRTCAAGKAGCSEQVEVLSTSEGGLSWSPAAG